MNIGIEELATTQKCLMVWTCEVNFHETIDINLPSDCLTQVSIGAKTIEVSVLKFLTCLVSLMNNSVCIVFLLKSTGVK